MDRAEEILALPKGHASPGRWVGLLWSLARGLEEEQKHVPLG